MVFQLPIITIVLRVTITITVMVLDGVAFPI